ncbi:MAG: hypothetical protein U1F57_01430 [bacterium]
MFIPILIGIASIGLVAGCSSDDSEKTGHLHPPPPDSPSPATSSPFPTSTCDPQAHIGQEARIKKTREEFCHLHQILMGESCVVNEKTISIGARETLPSIVQMMMEDRGVPHNFSTYTRETFLQSELSQLQGLSFYLHSGVPCEIDSSNDVRNLWKSYSLYAAWYRSENPEERRAFEEGRVRCLLRKGEVSSPHSPDAAGEEILTAATFENHPDLSSPLLVSACFALTSQPHP